MAQVKIFRGAAASLSPLAATLTKKGGGGTRVGQTHESVSKVCDSTAQARAKEWLSPLDATLREK
jgi:hypothetical protein